MKDCVKVISIIEGQKIYMPDKESTMKFDKKLKELDVQTRPGKNVEANIWSIYIISVPENLDGVSCEL